jgi:hypothetical protein
MALPLQSLESHWDWDLSARFRIGTLLATWGLVILAAPLAWVMFPLFAVRTAASTVQSVLNIRLGRRHSISKPTRFDWALVASIFVLAEIAAFATRSPESLPFAWMAAMLAPYTLLQLRMYARSRDAFRHSVAQHASIIRLERYADLEQRAA